MAAISTLTEDQFRREVIRVAEKYGYHVSHLESHQTSAGVPDLHIYKNGADIWLELKVVTNRGIALRPTQKKWHNDRARAGGKSWVAVLTGDGYILLVPGAVASGLGVRDRGWETASNTFHYDHIDSLIFALHHEALK